jgi:hypothetical protein
MLSVGCMIRPRLEVHLYMHDGETRWCLTPVVLEAKSHNSEPRLLYIAVHRKAKDRICGE